MKSATVYAASAIFAIIVCAMASRSALSSAQSGALMRLQPTSPGVVQTGSASVSGTMFMGGFRLGSSATPGHVLTADVNGNGTYQPLTLSGAAGGDLSGTYPNPLVDGLQGRAVSGTTPVTNQVLKWNGASWVPGTDSSTSFWTQTGANISYTSGRVGIGISSPVDRFHVVTTNEETAILGDNQNTSGFNYGVEGRGNFIGVQGVSPDAGGVGVRGVASAPGGYGLIGLCESSSGASRGVYAISHGDGGHAVHAWASKPTGVAVFADETSLTGGTVGVYSLARSDAGIGIYTETSHTTGTTYAVYGLTKSTDGTGVKGVVNPTNGFGVGVWGVCFAPQGWGVYSDGRLGASGTKLFRIDHPLDPENKWLQHYCTEGPVPQNVYNGTAQTDGKGYAWVELPSYFAAINQDYRYQLTVLDNSDDFVMAKVTDEIVGNRFRIRTSKANIKVSWEVKGMRNDLWVQKYGAPVEPEKNEREKGKYQHPELYGLPKEMGTRYGEERPTPPMPKGDGVASSSMKG